MTIEELLGYLVQVEDIEKPIIVLGEDDHPLTVVGVTEISNGVIFSLDILDADEVKEYNNKKSVDNSAKTVVLYRQGKPDKLLRRINYEF